MKEKIYKSRLVGFGRNMTNKNIKAVVLAAGKGTRMKSAVAKVLQPIFNKPLLGYVLDAIEKTGDVEETFVIVGHQAEDVEGFVEKNYSNAKCVLQMPQLGTGDAVAKVVPFLKNYNGDLLIICGDTPLITTETLNEFFAFHKDSKNAITLMSVEYENPTGYGRVVRDVEGNLKKIVEEKDADENTKKIKEVNAGIYCINWNLIAPAFSELKNNNAQKEYYLTDIIEWANEKGLKNNTYVLKCADEIFGINSKRQLAEATRILNERSLNKLMDEGVTIVDPISTFISPETVIGADTIVFPNTFINGKNIIGKNCKIGPMAHIRDGAEIGDNVRIGNFVEIKKSKIASNTNVSHLSYVGDAQLGERVNIGAGTITANYNSQTKVKSQTIIEDGASIGSNTVLVAPVKMGKNSMTGAGTIVTKDVEANALALTRTPLKLLKDWFKNKESN